MRRVPSVLYCLSGLQGAFQVLFLVVLAFKFDGRVHVLVKYDRLVCILFLTWLPQDVVGASLSARHCWQVIVGESLSALHLRRLISGASS